MDEVPVRLSRFSLLIFFIVESAIVVHVICCPVQEISDHTGEFVRQPISLFAWYSVHSRAEPPLPLSASV